MAHAAYFNPPVPVQLSQGTTVALTWLDASQSPSLSMGFDWITRGRLSRYQAKKQIRRFVINATHDAAVRVLSSAKGVE